MPKAKSNIAVVGKGRVISKGDELPEPKKTKKSKKKSE
jgi:hypothetical protein